MLLPRLGALLLAASYAHAIQNTAPFFVVSSDPIPSDSELYSTQYMDSWEADNRLTHVLGCDKKRYSIFEQDGVTASDLQAMTKLSAKIRAADQRKIVEIPHVLDTDGLVPRKILRKLEAGCWDKRRTINGKSETGDFRPLPGMVNTGPEEDGYDVVVSQTALPSKAEAKAEFLARTDEELANSVGDLLDGKTSGILIYIARPASASEPPADESRVYEMDDQYPEAPHIDLRRDTGLHRRQDGGDMQAGLPLFEKYQFLSPPLFMGLSVSLLLLAILSVGVRAIAGLDVSYMAFNKEMGPQAQRAKQQ